MKISILIAIAGSILYSCSKTGNQLLTFNFSEPEEIIKLPQRLHEISGITFYKKNEIACVQDEKGVIFFYNIKKDKLRNNIVFARDEDYEGITNVNDTLFVLCSNGIISEVDSTNEMGYANVYSTFLSKENNCEGLCFDEQKRRLLVACKGKPKKGTGLHGMKAVYSFDLQKRIMGQEPAYVINPDSVKSHLVNTVQKSWWKNLLGPGQNEEPFLFEPSEICIDPYTKDVYILSSVGKTLLAMSYDGKIKFAVRLNPEIFKQPEGMTFSADGSMFISDEGKGGKANLIKLRRTNNERL